MPETTSTTLVSRGDQFVWSHDDHPNQSVYITVTRVASDNTWADVKCTTWAVVWQKRQPLPLPEGTVRRVWSQADLDRDAEAFMANDPALAGERS